MNSAARWLGAAAVGCFLLGCGQRLPADEALIRESTAQPAAGQVPPSSPPAAEHSKATVATVGKKCPNFHYKTLAGKKVELSNYKGKNLILDVTSYT